MKSIRIGHEASSGDEVRLPINSFRTHYHIIGGTGKGKTTALHTMLHPLFLDPLENSCFFVIDRLGNFSEELLLWMASDYCTDRVRRRLLYLQPARDDVVAPFNPLMCANKNEEYFRVERTTEIILRAWESVNIEAMPRLARWTTNAFLAASKLGLTISDCSHFLLPASPYHSRLMEMLPSGLQTEWADITSARSADATRLLESSRNRLKPYFDNDVLRRMFGTTESCVNVQRMMEEGRIVIVDLSPRNRLSAQTSNAIGALLINEIIATIRNLPRTVRYPTYLFLDEFQNFVGPDLEHALPETRQMGLNLILSHQSFSQLQRGDYDMTDMIFTAQSRMIFGVQGEDADLLANEIASIRYDPRKVKEEIYSRRQLNKGQKIVELHNRSTTRTTGDSIGESDQEGQSENQSIHGDPFAYGTYGRTYPDNQTQGKGKNTTRGRSRGSSSSYSESESVNQTLVPEYEEFSELSSRTYETFEEQRQVWAREIRNLKTGRAILRLVNDPRLHLVDVKRSTPGFLSYDIQTIARKFPQAIESMDKLLAQNFASDFFVPAEVIDRQSQERLDRLLQSNVKLNRTPNAELAPEPDPEKNPFS
ncbi:MAG: type IV secretory system conjugative DNA transfer family protein [Planctomycetes bacterium]|nr:type IV secretory system conjugative DNA transfer family protein [Planctomycetota bacterium]